MSRVEENKDMLKEVDEVYETVPPISAERHAALHLGMIRAVLGDISKSLAIIADSISTERNKEHE